MCALMLKVMYSVMVSNKVCNALQGGYYAGTDAVADISKTVDSLSFR